MEKNDEKKENDVAQDVARAVKKKAMNKVKSAIVTKLAIIYAFIFAKLMPIILLVSVIVVVFNWLIELFQGEDTTQIIYASLLNSGVISDTMSQDFTSLVEIKGDEKNGYYLAFKDDADEKFDNVIKELNSTPKTVVPLTKDFLKQMVKAELVTQYPNLGGKTEGTNQFQGAIKIRRITPDKNYGEIKNTSGGETTKQNVTFSGTDVVGQISDEEKNLIATDLMCEYMNGRYYLIYDDKVLYYSVEADGMHKIMAYDEKTGMIKEIYSEPYKDSAAEDLVTPNYLYLLGKYSDYLVFMDQSYEQNLQEESGFLVILNLKDKEEIRVRSSYYMEGAYIQAACDKLITSTSDGGYSNLYMIDMKTGEIETISEKCRSTSGDYIKGTDFYYLEKRNGEDQIYYLVCYDLQKEKEDWSIELAGEWYEQNGCFWGNDLQENTYIITYDGVQYPYDGECKSLNRVDGQYVDCTSDGKIRKLKLILCLKN